MRITCPTCEAEYAVPDDKIVGRAVKCARCETRWTPVPPPVPPPEPPLDLLSPEAEPGPAPIAPVARPVHPALETQVPPPLPPAPPRQRSPALAVAWVASFALIAAGLAGAYAGRSSVVQAWPASARVYAAFGLR